MNKNEHDGAPPKRSVILPEAEVLRRAGIGRTTRWKEEKAGRFPARVRLSEGRIGWLERDIEAWIASRPTVQDQDQDQDQDQTSGSGR